MNYSENQIRQIASSNKKVRLTLKSDRMVFGKFVVAKDFDELINKRFVRFVTNSNIELFDGCSVEDPEQMKKGNLSITKLFVYSDFLLIQQFD